MRNLNYSIACCDQDIVTTLLSGFTFIPEEKVTRTQHVTLAAPYALQDKLSKLELTLYVDNWRDGLMA